MKNIFATLMMVCFVAAASAQSNADAPTKLFDSLPLKSLKPDTSLNRYMASSLKNPGNYFKMQQLPLAALTAAKFNTVGANVYSTMPVAHVNSGDNMPVARLSSAGFNMPVKRVIVAAPAR